MGPCFDSNIAAILKRNLGSMYKENTFEDPDDVEQSRATTFALETLYRPVKTVAN